MNKKKLMIICYLSSILAITTVQVFADNPPEDQDNTSKGNTSSSSNGIASGSASSSPQTTIIPPITTPLSTVPTTTAQPTTSKPAKNNNKCPNNCQCSDKQVNCRNSKLTLLPNLSTSKYTEFYFENNAIENLDFNSLPSNNMEVLDLSDNNIKSFTLSKKEPAKLKLLGLSLNSIEDLSGFSAIKFNQLETLDLSGNPIRNITSTSLNNLKNLKTLFLDKTKLKSIHEDSFSNLKELKFLNMSSIKLDTHLGDKQFANNQKLEILDLTDNGLIEVPFALRSTTGIKTLILNENHMTSLRHSDFLNRNNLITLHIRRCPNLNNIDESTFAEMSSLERLYITDNPKLHFISKDAFKAYDDTNDINYSTSARKIHLKVLDLRNNNITTMSDPNEFTSLTIEELYIEGNPWNCNCDLKWLSMMVTNKKLLIHCKSPLQYRDLEITQFFHMNDCDVANSSYHNIIVICFLLFLLGLAVAICVQKSDTIRRFLWKDQYGTIYYTKASFPPETV